MPIKPFQWQCPYCGDKQIATAENHQSLMFEVDVGKSKHGFIRLTATSMRCLNVTCNEIAMEARINRRELVGSNYATTEQLESWKLRPQSSAKPQPDYIPQAIRDDYREACLISDLSPKASATLSRRCLQGMIRDFCGVTDGTLNQEIKKLREQVNANKAAPGVTIETVEAIDHVRHIGNIGAHMEKDVNVIIDIDQREARTLITLIEMLFKEWYVARKSRQDALAAISAIGANKKAAKANPVIEAIPATPPPSAK